MTIRAAGEWGRSIELPEGLVAVSADADVMSVLDAGDRVLLVGGDIARTAGTMPIDRRGMVLELPIDLIEVSSENGVHVACAHVVARSSRRRGGWWFGPIVAVMNAEFIGNADVAPRGHPNDGRVEVLEVNKEFGVRDRWAVRQRLPVGSHIPHPAIVTRSVRQASWEFARDVEIYVDGRRVGTSRSLGIDVRPDAAVVHI